MKKKNLNLVAAIWDLLRIGFVHFILYTMLTTDVQSQRLLIYHTAISLLIPAMIFILWNNEEIALIHPIRMGKVLQISALAIIIISEPTVLFNLSGLGLAVVFISDAGILLLLSVPDSEETAPEYVSSTIEED